MRSAVYGLIFLMSVLPSSRAAVSSPVDGLTRGEPPIECITPVEELHPFPNGEVKVARIARPAQRHAFRQGRANSRHSEVIYLGYKYVFL